MILDEVAGLVKYAGKRVLKQYQWKIVFEKSRDNIFSILDDCQNDENYIRKIFGNKDFDNIIDTLDRDCGYGFIQVIKEKLENESAKLGVSKDIAEHYIAEFIKDVQCNLRGQFPDYYRDIVLEKSIQELHDGINSIHEEMQELAEGATEIYSIWQYDALLKRSNTYGIDIDFFDYNEEELDKNILEQLNSKNILYIKAHCREEGLYYILCLLKKHPQYNDDVFIVTNLKSWNSLEGKLSGKILIPFFYAENIVPVNQNTTVYIVDKSIPLRNKEVIDIPNRTKSNLNNILSKYIKDSNEVHRLLTRNIYIFPILKRELFEGSFSKPKWVCEDLKMLVPALLLSNWTDKEGDREIVELISGKNFDKYILELKKVTNTEDPFIVKFKGDIGIKFYVADLYQAWNYVADYINENNLNDFKEILDIVIPEKTSKIENGMRQVEIGRYSETLKNGLIKTLIFINLYSCDTQALQGKAEQFVNAVFEDANWDDIAELLPDLIEAAPSAFVSAVEFSLQNKNNTFMSLFKSKGAIPFEYANYTYLLFALEKGLFINCIKFECIRILEDLCKINIEGNIVNSPINTLSNLFCAFYDETDLGNERRANLLRYFANKDPENAWIVLKNILPKNRPAFYNYLSKPVYLGCNKKHTTQSEADTISLYKEYYKIAFLCASKDLSKWCDLYSDCIFIAYGFKAQGFADVQGLIQDKTISDEIKYKFSNTVRRFIYDCRYFNRRYVKEADVAELEEKIYNNIVYTNDNYRFLYAFENEYKPLNPGVYDERKYIKDWEKSQKVRENEELKIFEAIIAQSYDRLLCFLKLLHDEWFIGRSLAICVNYTIKPEICLALYTDNKNNILLQYFREVFYKKGTVAAFQQLDSSFRNYELKFKYILLQSLNIDQEFIDFLEKQSEEVKKYYWKHIRPVFKKDDYKFNKYYLDKLLMYGNINAAWDLAKYNDYQLEDYLYLLQSLLEFSQGEEKFEGSEYDIVSIFEKIYKMPVSNLETQNRIAYYEITFCKVFRFDNREIKPKFIYNQLALNPDISANLIKLSYKQDNGEEQVLSEEEAKIAENAWRVLFDISFCPCVDDKGIYYTDQIADWLAEFLKITKNNNQSEIGMHFLGRFLAHFPKGLYETWLPKEICQFIEDSRIYNNKINSDLTSGFVSECYYNVGPHIINEGKENIPLIVEYTSYAKATELNYPCIAGVFRNIASKFEQESRDRRECAIHEY